MPIHHVVLLKFHSTADPAAVSRYVEELAKMPRLNADIRNWLSGEPPERPFHNGDFDFGMACDLDDEAAMERYMAHPAHRRLAPFLQPILERQIAFDFVTPASTVTPTTTPTTASAPSPDDAPLDGLRTEKAIALLESTGRRVGKTTARPNPYWAEGFVLAHRDNADDTTDLVVSSPTRVGAGDPYEPAP